MNSDAAKRERMFYSFQRATEVPMLVLSLAIIPLLIAPWVLKLDPQLESTLITIDWAIWAFFAIELLVKTYLAPRRAAYLREHWFDVLIVALPFLRPLRIVRSAQALRLLKLVRIYVLAARYVHTARSLLNAHGLKYALLLAVLVIVGSAGLATLLERGAGGTIVDFEDGLWWAFSTITTVGYGDRFPVTSEGRGIAIFLMVTGITLFSVLTANIAAFLVNPLAGQCDGQANRT